GIADRDTVRQVRVAQPGLEGRERKRPDLLHRLPGEPVGSLALARESRIRERRDARVRHQDERRGKDAHGNHQLDEGEPLIGAGVRAQRVQARLDRLRHSASEGISTGLRAALTMRHQPPVQVAIVLMFAKFWLLPRSNAGLTASWERQKYVPLLLRPMRSRFCPPATSRSIWPAAGGPGVIQMSDGSASLPWFTSKPV